MADEKKSTTDRQTDANKPNKDFAINKETLSDMDVKDGESPKGGRKNMSLDCTSPA